MLLFSGQRYMGKRGPDDEIVGEKDFSVFIEFAGKYFIMLIEMKCIEEQSSSHRKKATIAKCWRYLMEYQIVK